MLALRVSCWAWLGAWLDAAMCEGRVLGFHLDDEGGTTSHSEVFARLSFTRDSRRVLKHLMPRVYRMMLAFVHG